MKICHYKEANRQFDNAGHRFAETSWWSRLSNNKQENLIRLFKDHNRDYLEAFNELRVIPGIWSGFRVSKLKDLFGLRCKEVRSHPVTHFACDNNRNPANNQLPWCHFGGVQSHRRG